MNRPRNHSWLRDLIVRTVWPYLKEVRAQVESLAQSGTPRLMATSSPSAGSGAAGRITEQINFTASSAPGGGYIAPGDGGGVSLISALLLYRARGGEVIRKFQLTQPAGLSDTWDIDIRWDSYNRGAAASFSVPVRVVVDSLDHRVEITPNQTLTAGQCLFAYVAETVDVAGRVDGTLEIERDATLS